MEYFEKADGTMKEWLQYWFEVYAKRNIKQSTAISYIGYINNHLVPQIGEYRLSEINTNLLQEFFNNRMDFGGKKCGPLSPKTLHNMKLMLHKSLKKAVELELLQRNYAEFVELPRQSKPNMRVLDLAEQRQLVTTLRHTNEKLYIGAMISLATGLRLGEVLGLKWSDIDYNNSMLHIRRTVNRLCTIDGDTKTEIVVGTPKSDSSVRDIPFNYNVQKYFEEYYTRSLKILGKRKLKSDDFVLSLRYGHPVEPKTMQSAFKRIVSEAKISDTNFHALRHTFATRAIEKGVDVKTLSVLLGHADISTTLNRYAHVLDDQKRKTMDILLSDY